ncbi:hypothetical protein DA83_02795 [Pseudomonas sp. 250J]|uniref:hypothetical protein n=1 Tax=unclassified Pseudomonas TaxID=196821 RepID=UPI000682CCD5|nr:MULTISPECIES: hypothetical protein [unclassified Pseudomonas]KNX77268.1 hypothetical protein DA83_02795 [Pseudomonas sp. 250J]QZA52523.1 hypothetical protein K2O50_15975 [Pseudomonas sp. 2hn]
MELNIKKLPSGEFEVQGQTVTRAFAEGIMLATLMATCEGRVARMVAIADQYEAVGLSIQGARKEASKVAEHRYAQAEAQRKRDQEAQWYAQRAREMASMHDPLEIARAKAKREARDAEIRAYAQSIRAARGGRQVFSDSDWA